MMRFAINIEVTFLREEEDSVMCNCVKGGGYYSQWHDYDYVYLVGGGRQLFLEIASFVVQRKDADFTAEKYVPTN